MDGKIEQHVCIKFCVKLGKSTTKILEMFHDAFGDYFLSRAVVSEWHSRLKSGKVLREGDEHPA
jgi:hypothetical protein